jgi:hypothetical protein
MEPKSEVYVHMKTGGLYVVLTDAELETDLSRVVVYKSLKDGRIWVRPASEFYDPERFGNLPRADCVAPVELVQ